MSMSFQTAGVNKPQTTKAVAFGNASAFDIDALKDKQYEIQRMTEQMAQVMGKQGEDSKPGFFDKVSKAVPKIFAVVIAFTAMKLCLGKAANMIKGGLNKGTDSVMNKIGEKVAEKGSESATKNLSKATDVIGKIKKCKIDKYVVNTIAGGAAAGVALQQFGLVKKNVSEDTANLVDNSIDKAQSSSNNYSGTEDFDISDDEI